MPSAGLSPVGSANKPGSSFGAGLNIPAGSMGGIMADDKTPMMDSTDLIAHIQALIGGHQAGGVPKQPFGYLSPEDIDAVNKSRNAKKQTSGQKRYKGNSDG